MDVHIMGERLNDIRVMASGNEYGKEEYLEIVFHAGDRLLRLAPLPETDEIHAEIVSARDEGALISLPYGHWLRELIGLKMGYVWTCTNSQGYDDLIVLSFGHLVPNLAVLCQCSTLRLLRMIEPAHRPIAP